jgi:hypothetical protein
MEEKQMAQKTTTMGIVVPVELKKRIWLHAHDAGFLSASEFIRSVLTKEINGGRNETMVSGATA